MSSATLRSLQEITKTSANSSEAQTKLVLTRLSSEIHHRTTEGAGLFEARDYFRDVVRALCRLRGTGNSELRLETLFSCYKYFFLNGCSDEALDAAQAILRLATQSKSRFWLRKAHASCGVICAEQHQVGDALVFYANALDLAQQDEDFDGLVGIWINLGIALNYGGLYREAIPCFDKAIQILEAYNRVAELEASALCNVAQSHYQLGNLTAGLTAIERCLAISKDPDSSTELFQRAVRELTFVQIALALHRPNIARFHAEECAKFAERSRSEKPRFIAELACGLVEVSLGDANSGIARLEAAANARTSEVQILKADALEALVRAYSEASCPDKALSALDALIKMIAKSRRSGLDKISHLNIYAPRITELPLEADPPAGLQSIQATLRAEVAERRLIEARVETLERMAVAAALREDDTGEHAYRVAALTAEIGRELGWTNSEQHMLEVAARLHDIGMSIIPAIGVETSHNRNLEALHTKVGAELLFGSDAPVIQLAELIARHHHEWWDGTGQPDGLSGLNIPLAARIVGVANSFDSLTHGRGGKRTLSVEEAKFQISELAGRQFDPSIVRAFQATLNRLARGNCDLEKLHSKSTCSSQFLAARTRIKRLLDSVDRPIA